MAYFCLDSGKIIELEYCEYEKLILCSSPILYHKFDCIEGILAHDARKVRKCDVTKPLDHALKVKRLSTGSLLIYSTGESIEERCKLLPTSTTKVNAGTYTISTNASCLLDSTSGWRFKAYESYNHDVNVYDVILRLNDVKLSFHNVDEPVTLP